MRGTRAEDGIRRIEYRFIPACAGNTLGLPPLTEAERRQLDDEDVIYGHKGSLSWAEQQLHPESVNAEKLGLAPGQSLEIFIAYSTEEAPELYHYSPEPLVIRIVDRPAED